MGSRSKKRAREAQQTQSRSPQPTREHTVRREGGHLVAYSESYSGPIPSADELLKYRDVDPAAPGIILGSFDRQGAHRRTLEAQVITGSERRADRGQLFVASLLGVAVVGGVAAVFAGHDAAGASVAGTAIGGGALVYLVGGRPPKED